MQGESSENIKYSSESFKAMDANSDNFVTTGEIKDYLKEKTAGLLSDDVYKQRSEAYIKATDIDNNGKMSLGEYALASMDSHQEIDRTAFETTYGKEEAAKLFDQYDTNKDGKINGDEIKAVDKEQDKSNGLSTGAIIGIIVGAVCLVGLIVGLVVYLSRKNKKEAQKSEQNGKDNEAKKGNGYDPKAKNISYTTQSSLVNINEKSKGKSR